MPVFHRLKTLRMDGLGFEPEALHRFPAVEHLVFTSGVFIPDSYHNSFFPKLKSYSGPYMNLKYFAACTELQQLSIWGEEPSQVIPRAATAKPAVYNEFSYPQPNSLQILEATFDLLTRTQVHDFMAQWPHLAELSLRCDRGFPEKKLQEHCADVFFNNFFPVLPSSLERLALRWDCTVPHAVGFLEVDMTPAPPTRLDELLDKSRCPRLKAVWLEGCEYLLRWRKSLQEPAQCFKIHYNSQEAQHKRDNFRPWWEDQS
uniref:F-box domain-containing protein n=1 Tax=Mycena chlorophos TaxID=658473 RepID=A0ABQ0M260_MYCCL|nr:predicted protein [Mycena chlorophos]